MNKIQAVVFVGMNPWHRQEINDTVRFLAAACRGRADRLYLEPPRGFREAAGDPAYLAGATRWQREVCDGIEIYAPPLGFAPVFLGLRKLADSHAAAKLDRLLRERYGPSWRERVLVYISSWSYTQTGLVQKLRPRHLLFHILDDSFAFPLIRDHPRVLAGNKSFYRYMMDRSSVVIAVSRELARKYAALYGRPVHVVRNGVDVEHFRPREPGRLPAPAQSPGAAPVPPPEMAGIPRPVLMYTGSINSWVDLPLLLRLAGARPGCSLVLIGHCYEGTVDAGLWRELLDRPNVHWLRSRPYGLLPGYLHCASALLLPRTGAEHSRASDPLKLYEYLSTGKPVVSTALPAVEDFRAFVYVPESREGFAAATDAALKDHGPDRAARQAAMMEKHSWTARVNDIAEILAAHCGLTM